VQRNDRNMRGGVIGVFCKATVAVEEHHWQLLVDG